MTTTTLVGIHALEKEEGIYASLYSASPLNLDLFHLA
jgi:hypothetical protein